MKIKLLFLIFALALAGSLGAGSVEAQTATFPAGCSSALGYSVTTGEPCSGEDDAIMGPLPGCSTALGFSTVNGRACSGGDVAINFLAGCTSIYGYSTITSMPCNGTSTAQVLGSTPVPPVVNPAFPATGFGGNALVNTLYLGSSALIVALGLFFLSRPSRA